MKYLQRIFFILNKYIPLNNYSINYFKGGIQDSFGNNIQQIGLALVYIEKIRGNFYFKNHTYINQFSVINSRFHNLLRFFKKKYRFFYFNKKETDFYKRKNYFDDTENDFPINSNEMIEYKELIGSVLKKYVTPNLNFFENIELNSCLGSAFISIVWIKGISIFPYLSFISTKPYFDIDLSQIYHGSLASQKYPETQKLTESVLCLPIHSSMNFEHIRHICNIITQCKGL